MVPSNCCASLGVSSCTLTVKRVESMRRLHTQMLSNSHLAAGMRKHLHRHHRHRKSTVSPELGVLRSTDVSNEFSGYAQPQAPTPLPSPPPPPEHDGYAQPQAPAPSYGIAPPVFRFPAMPTLPPLPTFPPMQFPPLPTLPPMQLPSFPPIQNMFANWPSSYASGPTSAGAAYASPPQSPSIYGNATPQRPGAVPPPQQHPASAGSAPSGSLHSQFTCVDISKALHR